MKKSLARIVVFSAVVLTVCAAWATKYPLTINTIVPAAKGEVEVKTGHNGNTEVDLKVDHLAQAASLTPPATTYVIWFQQQGEQPQNEGELKVGKNLKAEFKNVTPMKNFEVFATAESDPMAKKPSGQQVFHATVQR